MILLLLLVLKAEFNLREFRMLVPVYLLRSIPSCSILHFVSCLSD